MNALTGCPEADSLVGMLDGKLAENEQARVTEHVTSCETCQQRLDSLVTHGLREDLHMEELGDYLRRAGQEDTALSHEAIHRLTAALCDATAPWLEQSGRLSLDFLQPSEEADSLGRLGQYEITEVVGRGGMGIVLKGRDTRLDRIVAVKVLAPELASNPTARRRFLREAQAAAAVSHDHVVTTFAVEPGDLPYLAMEYIDGVSLQQKLDRGGPLELREILRIGMQTAYGLAAAHAQGLIHRDIKPSNILLQNNVERVQITDFGLARAVDDVTITRTGEITGTPQYMSPEQARGLPADQRTDLFSLGSVLYAMCTGRSPFRAESTMAVLHRVCNDAPRAIREVNPDIPDWLVAIVDRLLEKNRDDRFQTAAEVADVLSQYLAHVQQPTVVPLPEPILGTSRIRTRFSGRPKWYIGAILLALTLGSLALTEAAGVTNLAATVIRIAMGEGTLVIEVDDPSVEVSLDGEELTITGAGIQELRLRPGQYQFRAIKDGQPVKRELVTITRGDRQIVRVTCEAGRGTVETTAESRSWAPWNLPAGSPPPAIAPFLPEDAPRHQRRWAKYLGVPVEIENSIGMKMVLIPPGEYEMSLIPVADDMPFKVSVGTDTQRVAVAEPFRIGKCEVDVAQFRRFVEATGYVTRAEKSDTGGAGFLAQRRDWSAGPICWKDPGFPQDKNHPVVHVCWYDAAAFCRWLSSEEGRTYRLPRNAEWEYACLAGKNTKFSSGEAEKSLIGAANVLDKSTQSAMAGLRRVDLGHFVSWDDRHPFTAPVASFRPNAFGLYDMHGNVWEHCEEVFDRLSPHPVDERLGIARGGAYDAPPVEAGSDFALWFSRNRMAWTIGFRVVSAIEVTSGQVEANSSEPEAEAAIGDGPTTEATAEKETRELMKAAAADQPEAETASEIETAEESQATNSEDDQPRVEEE